MSLWGWDVMRPPHRATSQQTAGHTTGVFQHPVPFSWGPPYKGDRHRYEPVTGDGFVLGCGICRPTKHKGRATKKYSAGFADRNFIIHVVELIDGTTYALTHLKHSRAQPTPSHTTELTDGTAYALTLTPHWSSPTELPTPEHAMELIDGTTYALTQNGAHRRNYLRPHTQQSSPTAWPL